MAGLSLAGSRLSGASRNATTLLSWCMGPIPSMSRLTELVAAGRGPVQRSCP